METAPDTAPARQDTLPDIERDFSYLTTLDTSRLQQFGGNILRRANSLIDSNIANLHESFPTEGDDAKFEKDNTDLKNVLDYTASVLSMPPESNTGYNDYFRLANAHDFAVESVAAHEAYSSVEEIALREEIVDGIAGKSIARMEEVIDLHDHETSGIRRKHLRGVLTELLALSLVNYKQDPSRVALPSSIEDDLAHTTDMYIYHLQNNKGFKAPVQIKTGLLVRSPKNGFTLNSNTLGKTMLRKPWARSNVKQNFPLARILVKEINGEDLTEVESMFMKKELKKFERELSKELIDHPGATL